MDVKQLKQVLVPTWGQVLTCVLASLLLFVLTYWGLIFQRTVLADPHVAEVSRQHLANISKLKSVDVMVKVVFWSGLGLVAYIVYLTVSNALVEARNSVVIESSYTNKGRPEDRLPAIFKRLATTGACLSWLVLAAKVLLPWSLTWFEKFIVSPRPDWAAFTIAVLSCALTAYVAWTFIQIALAE
jgi:hypothetical protein